jgi:hypothetical protein
VSPPPETEAELLHLADWEELVVFRIVRLPDAMANDYVESFKSHFELGIPPRGPEQSHPLVYEGISVYDTYEAAASTARKFPTIGSYVAKLMITAETNARYFRWGPPGHLTLWGDSLTLAHTTVDTISVNAT